MTKKVDFLLVGGGLASATAAETLRLEGADGTIAILSAEEYLPYQRPPLSTQFLLGTQTEDQLPIFDDSFYREHSVDVILGTRASHLDANNQVVQTDRAGEIQYGKLLIATGAAPIRLQIPGATLPGIHYLRTLTDANNIRRAAETAKRVVVIGGSFLGHRTRRIAQREGNAGHSGRDEKILLDKLKSQSISDFFNRYYRRSRRRVVLGDEAVAFLGEAVNPRRQDAIRKTLPCDLALVATGVAPDVGFLRGTGIALEDGIVVDRCLQTNQPHIFAAGDVANFFDPVFNIRRRVEHWDNAIKQGRLAAKNMLGQRAPYDEVSYFFCDVFDISFDFFGLAEIADEQIARGSLSDGSFALFYLKEEVPRALFSLGRPPQETKAVEALIRYRVNLQAMKSQLSDPQFPLEQIPARTYLFCRVVAHWAHSNAGVVKALEERGIYPDIVAGVSIGAFNGAVIAGNPKNPGAALEAFWHDLEVPTPEIPNESLRRTLSSWNSLIFGSPKFFRPEWFTPIFGGSNQVLRSIGRASTILRRSASYSRNTWTSAG